MGKSIRSKREKRLRAIRREMVEPIYEKKDAAKLAAQEAALNAPKLPVKPPPSADGGPASASVAAMEIEMSVSDRTAEFLKPTGKEFLKPMGKKMKKKVKIAKKKFHGKGKIRRKNV